MLALYIHRVSPIHRIGSGVKLLACFLGGTAIFFCEPVWGLLAILLAIAGLYRAAKLPFGSIISSLKPVLLISSFVFILQFLLADLHQAFTITLRIVAVILLTSLVTLTTRFSDMIEVLSRISAPLARFGLSPSKLALAVSLAIRFIPALLHDFDEIRQAKIARRASGLKAFAAGPLVVKILHMTDTVGNAIAARGFDNRK